LSRARVFLAALILLLSYCPLPYADDPQVEKKINGLIKKMSLDDKVTLIAGSDMDTYPIEKLGIQRLKMCDGPVGVRRGQATAFPSSICMAATWDPEMVYRVSSAIADEAKARGRNMSLAPCINILRVPMGGRNFESFGEDPYLASRMAVAYVKGLQDNNVIATVKHYACNNQEWERASIDVKVDERALREIYLPAFEAAVKEGGSWSVMAAYNKVNGYYCSENKHLLNDILKKEWAFKGFVVSDWGATHSTIDAANYGLDLEMPKGNFFNDDLTDAVRSGDVKESVIDDKVRRILRAIFWLGLFDAKATAYGGALDTPEHRQAAFESAREGMVLLKNSGALLPIDLGKVKSIAVIGPNASVNRYGGGGSSAVTPFYSISLLDALKKRLGGKTSIRYAPGCLMENELKPVESSVLSARYNNATVKGLTGEYFNNRDLSGSPALTRVDGQVDFNWHGGSPDKKIRADVFSARWKGRLSAPASDEYELQLASDDGSRLYINGELIIDNWGDHSYELKGAKVKLEAGKSYDLVIEYYDNWGEASVRFGWVRTGQLLNDAVEAAKRSDIAIVCAGLSWKFESEGSDRLDMALPDYQEDLIKAVAAANKNTVVVLNNGAPVTMDRWIDAVPALIESWYAGQEGGSAVSEILLGSYNPSGKLPTTFPRRWEDCSAYGSYPGEGGETSYSDGIFVGYRHFDKKETDVLFPFGCGLSYTTFEYSNLLIKPEFVSDGKIDIEVSFDLKNTGRRQGAEVAQLYIRDIESSLERPVKELKGFKRVELEPGKTKRVTFRLNRRSLAFYDAGKMDWVAEPGEFEALVGSSSRDIKLKGTFTLQKGRLL